MAEIKKVLLTVVYEPESMEKVKEALAPAEIFYAEPRDLEAIRRYAPEVDVAIFNSDVPIPVSELKKVKWIHCSHAGIEKSLTKEYFERNLIVTNASGRSNRALAEHAFMFMMSLTYNMPKQMANQRAHIWNNQGIYPLKTGLYEKTIGVIGLGHTGTQVARLAKTFDMTVLGYRRSPVKPENVDEVYTSDDPENLKRMLSRCDYVVLCCEHNAMTHHMIGKEELASMKKSAILVNMGRGGLIVEEELIEALKDGTIYGAGLDTVTKEPLSPESPLWDLENVLITPHATPAQPDKEAKMVSFLLQNIRAYKGEGEFINRVTETSLLKY